MATLELLITYVAVPTAKFLFKRYISDSATAGLAGDLTTLVGSGFNGVLEKRTAERQFTDFGDRIVKQLVPLFSQHELQDAAGQEKISLEAVAQAIGTTLEGKIDAGFFLEHDLDPVKLTATLKADNPNATRYFSADEDHLYNRGLDEVVRYVVAVADTLPTFRSTAEAESLQQLSRIEADIETVLDAVRQVERAVVDAPKQESEDKMRRFEADYRQAVRRKLNYMELFGVDIKPESRRHQLSIAYISLSIQAEEALLPIDEQVGEDEDIEGLGETMLPVEEVLDHLAPDTARLFLKGEAGSGKSTLFRWIAIETAQSVAEGETGETWRSKIPFLIRLRDCPKGILPRPADFPQAIALEIGTAPEEWVLATLKAGRGLVLLDGIDEVAASNREQFKTALKNLIEAYPDNYFIVSSRPAGLEKDYLGFLSFTEAKIEELAESDKQVFIARWHDAVRVELEKQNKPDPDLTAMAERLARKLSDLPGVNRMAGTPLLLAMLCALHRERSEELPDSQSGLCDAVCQMLLVRREQESGFKLEDFPDSYRKLKYEQKRSLVTDLADYMVRNSASSMERADALRIVKERLEKFPDISEQQEGEVLAVLVERCGMLRERSFRGDIEFIHNTLKEYLAADRYAERRDVGALVNGYKDATIKNVIVFAAGVRDEEFVTKLFDGLLGGNRAQKVLALLARHTAINISTKIKAELTSFEPELFPLRSKEEAIAIASSGNSIIPKLKFQKNTGAFEASYNIIALRNIGSIEAINAIKDYSSDSRVVVVRELISSLPFADIKSAMPIITNKLVTNMKLSGAFSRINSLPTLPNEDNITSLNIQGTDIRDLSFVSRFKNLETINIGMTSPINITPLIIHGKISKIIISGNQNPYKMTDSILIDESKNRIKFYYENIKTVQVGRKSSRRNKWVRFLKEVEI
jgi:hypothetical protein